MEDEKVNFLPIDLLRKSSVIEYFRIKINYKKEMKKADCIIDELSKIKEFDVLSMPAFKQIVNRKIKSNPNGVIIMSDINNLYELNKFNSKKVVNKDIKLMISEMKNYAVLKNVNEFEIGKMGDEIYMYLPNIDEVIGNEFLNYFHDIKINLLSFSCGFTSDLKNGLEIAMEQAEEKMQIEKCKYKFNQLKKVCKGDVDKIINYCIEKEFLKARIDLEKIRNNSENIKLINVYDRVVNNKFIIDIMKNNKIEKTEKIKNIDLEERYKKESEEKFGNISKEEKEKYILAQILSRCSVENTITNEYFEYFEKDNLKRKKNIEFLAIDISGLKFVNDEYGYKEGDIEIENVLENLNISLNELNIKKHTKIVVKASGNAFVVLNKITEEEKQKIINKISNIDTKLDVICTIKGKENLDRNKKFKNGIEIFDELRNISENDLIKKSFERKITDEKNIEKLIGRIYKSIFDNELINCAILNTYKNKTEILEKIDKNFLKIISQTKENSNINTSDYLENKTEDKMFELSGNSIKNFKYI